MADDAIGARLLRLSAHKLTHTRARTCTHTYTHAHTYTHILTHTHTNAQWFEVWRGRIEEAVAKGQRLQVFFFAGRVGEGGCAYSAAVCLRVRVRIRVRIRGCCCALWFAYAGGTNDVHACAPCCLITSPLLRHA